MLYSFSKRTYTPFSKTLSEEIVDWRMTDENYTTETFTKGIFSMNSTKMTDQQSKLSLHRIAREDGMSALMELDAFLHHYWDHTVPFGRMIFIRHLVIYNFSPAFFEAGIHTIKHFIILLYIILKHYIVHYIESYQPSFTRVVWVLNDIKFYQSKVFLSYRCIRSLIVRVSSISWWVTTLNSNEHVIITVRSSAR